MIGFNIHSNIDQIISRLERITKAVENGASIGVTGGAEVLQKEIVQEIRNIGAVASSELVQSVVVSPVTTSIQGVTATVSSNKEYASVIEYGRRAGSRFPPRDRILRWMIVKGLEPSDSGAYLIARKIARDGIVGKHPFQKGTEKALPKIFELVAQAITGKLVEI